MFDVIVSRIQENQFEEQIEDLLSYFERTNIREKRGNPRFGPKI